MFKSTQAYLQIVIYKKFIFRYNRLMACDNLYNKNSYNYELIEFRGKK